MKLYHLLAEQEQNMQQQLEQYAEYIIRDCKPFLDQWEWGSDADFIYRGINGVNEPFINRKVRGDRRPMDTPRVMHDAADQWFVERFNYPYRSAGLFTTGNIMEADSYGTLYVVFPIGQFSYVWSPVYDLLFVEMDHAYDKHLEDKIDVSQGDAYQVIDQLLKEGDYRHNQDLDQAIRSGHEILFACDQFYGIRATQNNIDDIAEILLNIFDQHH